MRRVHLYRHSDPLVQMGDYLIKVPMYSGASKWEFIGTLLRTALDDNGDVLNRGVYTGDIDLHVVEMGPYVGVAIRPTTYIAVAMETDNQIGMAFHPA